MGKNEAIDKNYDNASKLLLLCSTLMLVFSFFVYGPFEMYLTNIDEFWFTLDMFWWIPLIVAACAFIVVYLIGRFLPKRLRIIYALLLVGVGLAVYVQSNFINLKVGVLNGGQINWGQYKKQIIINFIIWTLIIITPVLVQTLISKKYNIQVLKVFLSTCCFLFLVQAITLGTLFLTTNTSKQANETYAVSDKNLFELSTNKNTVVFLLDMFDDSYFKQILEETPEIKEEYQGFTYFSNSVGSYSTTKYSVSALLTNKVNHNSSLTYQEEIEKEYNEGTMFQELTKNNVDLDIYTYDVAVPKPLMSATTNYIPLKARISDYKNLALYLYRLTGCKYAPDIFKYKYWMTGSEFDKLRIQDDGKSYAYSFENKDIYAKFTSSEISTSSNDRFKFIHINGSHYPYTIDENVNDVNVDMNRTNAVKAARGSLKIVQEYISKMKEASVYDNSQIIIMADHGYYWDGTLTNPVLLIKPCNSNGEFAISVAPVSHYDFQATVMDNWGLNNDDEYGESVFNIKDGEQRSRLFYQYYLQEKEVDGKHRLIEYSVDSDNNLRKSFHLTDKEYTVNGELISHLANCAYCQKYGEGSDDVDGEVMIVHSKK